MSFDTSALYWWGGMFPHHSLAHDPVQYPVPEGFGCVERYTEQGEHLTGTVPSRLMEWYLSQVSAGFAYLCRVLQESGDLMVCFLLAYFLPGCCRVDPSGRWMELAPLDCRLGSAEFDLGYLISSNVT
ncbi:hypothetical protein R1flu_027895 [Riccia fluitans]|uniref:Uncharacterized protein n=1 Tax=Riccia fluitans TaxID=41844 RepID=A0ABD1XK41_9MARC